MLSEFRMGLGSPASTYSISGAKKISPFSLKPELEKIRVLPWDQGTDNQKVPYPLARDTQFWTKRIEEQLYTGGVHFTLCLTVVQSLSSLCGLRVLSHPYKPSQINFVCSLHLFLFCLSRKNKPRKGYKLDDRSGRERDQ